MTNNHGVCQRPSTRKSLNPNAPEFVPQWPNTTRHSNDADKVMPVEAAKAPVDDANKVMAVEVAKAPVEHAKATVQNKATIEPAKEAAEDAKATVEHVNIANGTNPPRAEDPCAEEPCAEDPWSTFNRFACLSGLEQARTKASKTRRCHRVRRPRSAHGISSSSATVDTVQGALVQTTLVSRTLWMVVLLVFGLALLLAFGWPLGEYNQLSQNHAAECVHWAAIERDARVENRINTNATLVEFLPLAVEQGAIFTKTAAVEYSESAVERGTTVPGNSEIPETRTLLASGLLLSAIVITFTIIRPGAEVPKLPKLTKSIQRIEGSRGSAAACMKLARVLDSNDHTGFESALRELHALDKASASSRRKGSAISLYVPSVMAVVGIILIVLAVILAITLLSCETIELTALVVLASAVTLAFGAIAARVFVAGYSFLAAAWSSTAGACVFSIAYHIPYITCQMR